MAEPHADLVVAEEARRLRPDITAVAELAGGIAVDALSPQAERITKELFGTAEVFEGGQTEAVGFYAALLARYDVVGTSDAQTERLRAQQVGQLIAGRTARQILEEAGAKAGTSQTVYNRRSALVKDFQAALPPEAMSALLAHFRQNGELPPQLPVDASRQVPKQKREQPRNAAPAREKVADSGDVSGDPVRDYLKSIGKTPLLTAEEEVDLSKAIEAGLYAGHLLETKGDSLTPGRRRELNQLAREGESAKNLMIQSNLRLVVSLAKRYTGQGMEFLDLISEGNLGLIRAVEKFDYEKGFKFSTDRKSVV